MTRTIAVFVDALKPESLQHMPFLSTLHSRRIKTELGYSNTCHASMYTGVYPSKHRSWFIWRYQPDKSPFAALRRLGKLSLLNNVYAKFICYALLLKAAKGTIIGGFPLLGRQRLSNWGRFDAEMVDFLVEPRPSIGGYPTVFEILRGHSVEVRFRYCKGIPWLEQVLGALRPDTSDTRNRLDFVFVGEVDAMSHRHGQDDPLVGERLRIMDGVLERHCRKLDLSGNSSFVLFSDHGHLRVTGEVDLYTEFRARGRNLDDYIHFEDSNYARFWFRNDRERTEVVEVLAGMNGRGYILTEDMLARYHVNMRDNAYGDVVFYLDRPWCFATCKIGLPGRNKAAVVSLHGFLPDYPDSDGVFVATRPLTSRSGSHVRLQDVPPSLLDLFGAEIPRHMDGQVVWDR